jgi:urease beta subunit
MKGVIISMKIGEVITCGEELELNAGKATATIVVSNTGDRPIQVGSHFHFFEVNKFLHFDRTKAFGFRLDIPSGTSVRFEPGETKEVNLVEIGGKKLIYGFNDLTCGPITDAALSTSIAKAKTKGTIQGE